MITATEETATVEQWVPKPADRCDRCNGDSRAYTRATKGDLELFLCGHHTRQYETVLIMSGWDLDIRIDILEFECQLYAGKTTNPE